MKLPDAEIKRIYKKLNRKLADEHDHYRLDHEDLVILALALEELLLIRQEASERLQEDNYEKD